MVMLQKKTYLPSSYIYISFEEALLAIHMTLLLRSMVLEGGLYESPNIPNSNVSCGECCMVGSSTPVSCGAQASQFVLLVDFW